MKLMKVENEIEDVRAHSIDLRAQMQIIDNEYGFQKFKVDTELKKILDEEDRKRNGVIGETYNKLNEIMSAYKHAQDCVNETEVYQLELDSQGEQWDHKTKEDLNHIQKRLEKLRKHAKDIDMGLMKTDTLRSRSTSPNEAAKGDISAEEHINKINIDEVDLDLLRSQRSYLDQDVELQSINSRSPASALYKEKPRSISPVPNFDKDEYFHKLRVVFLPFNEMYEISTLRSERDHYLITALLPLLEGQRVFLLKSHIGRQQYPEDYLKGRERIIRLTPDVKRIELRGCGDGYKIDKFYKVHSLQGVFITNHTRL